MEMANQPQDYTAYSFKSLEDIQERKLQLRRSLRKDSQQMKDLMAQLFHKPTTKAASTPAKRLQRVINTGTSVIDGALLGWKLYHKFKRGKLF